MDQLRICPKICLKNLLISLDLLMSHEWYTLMNEILAQNGDYFFILLQGNWSLRQNLLPVLSQKSIAV